MMDGDSNLHDECGGTRCAISTNRREFLRRTMLSMAGALVAAGASSVEAMAMPLEFTSGERFGRASVAYAIPAADGAEIDKHNEVILVRWQNAVYAFDLSCPHQNTALHWEDGDHDFQCPKHHSRFKPSGEYVEGSGRATRNMDRFAIVRDNGQVRVDLDKLYQNDTDPTAWAGATIKLV
jgi:nitrite reductase/ring-hydroxylating ferredoxin subunit